LPRILPVGRRVFLRRGSWPRPPVFPWIERLGNIDQAEMYRVFNQGIGFVLIVSAYFVESIQRQLGEDRVPSYVIGEVREGEPGVEFVAD
jgi:phosphoribosylformylglycinamidine cyclo-ligase